MTCFQLEFVIWTQLLKRFLLQILILECLYTSEEAQVERAGDLDGFQGQGGRAERESDRINHLCVHQQLGTLTAVSQASLQGERREHMGRKWLICS